MMTKTHFVLLTAFLVLLGPTLSRGQGPEDRLRKEEAAFRRYHDAGLYEKALPHAESTRDLLAELKGTRSMDYARSLDNLGRCYRAIDKADRALSLYRESYLTKKAILGKEDPVTIRTLLHIGALEAETGNKEAGFAILKQALAAFVAIRGQNHDDVANAHFQIGVLYGLTGSPDQGYAHFSQGHKTEQALHPEGHPHILQFEQQLAAIKAAGPESGGSTAATVATEAKTVFETAQLLYRSKKYVKSAEAAMRAARLTEQAYGAGSRPHADMLSYALEGYMAGGAVKETSSLVPLAMQANLKAYGAASPRAGRIAMAAGTFFRSRNIPDRAIVLLQGALSIQEKSENPLPGIEALVRHELGLAYQQAGDPEQAIEQLEAALALRRSSVGAKDPQTQDTMMNLAAILNRQQKPGPAGKLFAEIVDVRKKEFGEAHAATAQARSNLGLHFLSLYELEKAGQELGAALNVIKALPQDQGIGLGESFANMALYHHLYGEPATSIGMYQRAMPHYLNHKRYPPYRILQSMTRAAQSAGHISSMLSVYGGLLTKNGEPTELVQQNPRLLSEMARTYRRSGRPTEALSIARLGAQMTAARFGDDHLESIQAKRLVADTLAELGKMDEAHGMRLAETRQLTELERPPLQALPASHYRLGLSHMTAGDLPAAIHALEKAHELQLRLSGKDHLSSATINYALGVAHSQANDVKKALTHYAQAINIRAALLGSEHPDMSRLFVEFAELENKAGQGGDALKHLLQAQAIDQRLTKLFPVMAAPERADAIRDYSLAHGRALLLQAAQHHASSTRMANAAATSVLRSHAMPPTWLRPPASTPGSRMLHEFEAAMTTRPSAESASTFSRYMKELNTRVDALSPATPEATPAAIAAALSPSHAAIDFVLTGRGKNASVVAIIYRKGLASPHLVPLGSASELIKRTAAFRKALAETHGIIGGLNTGTAGKTEKAQARARIVKTSGELYTLTIQPLLTHLANASALYISAEGPLGLIPFEALMSDDSGFLVEQYRISRLSSPLDVLRSGTPSPKGDGNVLIVATPKYSYLADHVMNASPEHQFRSFPGAGDGIIYVSGQINANPALTASLLMGDAATETELTKLKLSSVVHIDALDFVATPSVEPVYAHNCPDEQFMLLRTLMDRKSMQPGDQNPQAGIALTGANYGIGKYKGSDGRLTLKEISKLDMSRTRLIVFSGTDSSLAGTQRADYILNLQDAAHAAGARHVMIRMWPTPNQDAMSLMATFYKVYKPDQDPAAALRATQLSMIKVLGKRNGFAHPYYWAGYTVSGM